MNILIVANHFPVCSARYAADAFTRLGHSVRHVGPAKGAAIWGLTLPAEYVWEPDDADSVDDGVWLRVGNSGYGVDLIVVMDSDPDILESVSMVDNAIPCIVWGVDNHVRDYRRPWFDHYFLAHRSVSVMPWGDPEHVERVWKDRIAYYEPVPRADMTWLPCAYDPTIFTPSLIPWAERAYDVCMIGVMYPQRWALVNAMKAAGLKVMAGTGLVYRDCAAAYQNSRVSLCASSNGDLAQRVFETAACGCAVLSDPLVDLNGSILPFTFYRSIDEAVTLAKELQGRFDLGRDAADGLYFSRKQTWDARAQVIVDWHQQRASEGAR